MYKSTLTLSTILFAALANGQGQDVNPTLLSEISSIDQRIQTAYTTDPGWSSFTAAATSWESEFLATNTITDGLTSLLPLLSTASDPTAVFASISSSVVAEIVSEHNSGFVDFVSTQTYLGDAAGNSLHSDVTKLVSLVAEATAAAEQTATGGFFSSATGSTATTGVLSSIVTSTTSSTRTSTTSTGTSTSTSPASAATTTSSSGSNSGPGISGVFAFAVAGVVAVVAML
jgi:hypothetical protein